MQKTYISEIYHKIEAQLINVKIQINNFKQLYCFFIG